MTKKMDKSNEYRSRIHDLIPGGAHTYSKGDDQFPTNAPAAIQYGKGAWVWDLDGNKFLDCSMGLTSVGLGHAYGPVVERVKAELDNGVNFQRPSYIEKEMAEAFLELIPAHDMIKFSKNGSTATSAAVKLARAYTGRDLAVFPGDHPFYSYDDWFIGKTVCPRGVPARVGELTLTYPSQNLDALEELFKRYPGQIACVITEPERCGDEGDAKARRILDLCEKNGALFIADEMITGYKTAFPGAMTKYGFTPHLATWGKGIANGFSFCALTGIRDVMELGGIRSEGAEKVFLVSTTHGGESHAIAAALATLQEYKKHNVVQYTQKIGRDLVAGVQSIIKGSELQNFVKVTETCWMPAFGFLNQKGEASLELRTLAMQEMIECGVLFQGIFIPCFSHGEAEVKFFLDAFAETMKVYKRALNGETGLVRGHIIKPVFRKYL